MKTIEQQSEYFVRNYPILAKLLRNGDVSQEGCSYVGLASDGTVVHIGSIVDPNGAERYLSARPTPDKW